jgi:hypothetical protein
VLARRQSNDPSRPRSIANIMAQGSRLPKHFPCNPNQRQVDPLQRVDRRYVPVPRMTTLAVRTRIFRSSQKLQFSTYAVSSAIYVAKEES